MQELTRSKLIDDCSEKGISRFDTNVKLREKGYNELNAAESDCYEILISAGQSKKEREKIINESLAAGYSRCEANLKLLDKKFRPMNSAETDYYEELLSRVRAAEIGKPKTEKQIPPRDDVIFDAVFHQYESEELNDILQKFHYSVLSGEETVCYDEKLHQYIEKRDEIINSAINNGLSIKILNKNLSYEGCAVLSDIDEINFRRQKEKVLIEKRKNIIKECLEEKISFDEIDDILKLSGLAVLSAEEKAAIRAERLQSVSLKQKHSTGLSPRFKSLYREASKKFHPDRYKVPEDKELAEIRMKEINRAKDSSDYALLKSLVAKYEKEDNE